MPVPSSTHSSAVSENVAKLRGFIEDISPNHYIDGLPDYVHDDVVLPADIPPAGRQGIEGVREHLLFMKAILEHRASVEDIVADGDKVAARVRISGRQIGELMGVKNEGREFAVDEMMIAQFRDGKISQVWRVIDLFGLLGQLGGRPGPPPR